MPRIADALSPRQYEGTPLSEMATAAPPTYAQQAARIPGRIMDALRALGTGTTYGSAEPTNSISDLARAKFWRGSVFGVPEDVQQRNVARATDIAMMAAPIVYHGTPHRFAATAKNPLGEFDPTKIGSGEGAQAYGYGHYLAEAPGVANEYRRTLRNMNPSYEGVELNDTVQKTAADLLIKAKGDKAEAIKNAQNYAFDNLLIPEINKMDASKVSYGQLYKVDLPDEVVPQMLNYDKPIKEQPEILKAFRARLPEDMLKAFDTNVESGISGANAMQNWLWNSGKTDASRSETLRQMGIPGIKYLDAGSRGASTGTRNFVVFPGNESLLKILGRE